MGEMGTFTTVKYYLTEFKHYFQEILERAAASLKSAEQGVQRASKPVIEMSAQNNSVQIVSSASRSTGVAAMDVDNKKV